MAQSSESSPNPEPSRSQGPLTGRQVSVYRILVGVSIPFFVLCLLCFFGEILFSTYDLAGPRTEFPLGNPTNVVVDSKGRIYVAEGAYARVQRYSADGQFERGWWVSEGAFHFALRIMPDDFVQVATAADYLVTYSPDGELISNRRTRGEGLVAKFETDTTTSGGYEVRHALYPHVVDTRTGRTVIKPSWPQILVAFPFPAWGYWLIFVFGVGVSQLWAWLARRTSRTAYRTVAPAMNPLPPAIRVAEGDTGLRFELPRREALPGAHHESYFWFGSGIALQGLAVILFAAGGFGLDLIAVAFGIGAVILGGLFLLMAWCRRVARYRVDVTDELRLGEHFYFVWDERTLSISDLRKFVYYTFNENTLRDEGTYRAGSGVIAIESQCLPPIYFAAGYPPDLLRPLGQLLAERCRVPWEESRDNPAPLVRRCALPLSTTDVFLTDEPNQPPGSVIQVITSNHEQRIVIPPLPFWQNKEVSDTTRNGMALGGAGITVFVIFLGSCFPPLAILAPVLLLVSGVMICRAIRRSRREYTLVLQEGQLTIIQSRPSSAEPALQTLTAPELIAVRVGGNSNSSNPKHHVWTELHLIRKDGTTIRQLAGRDGTTLAGDAAAQVIASSCSGVNLDEKKRDTGTGT